MLFSRQLPCYSQKLLFGFFLFLLLDCFHCFKKTKVVCKKSIKATEEAYLENVAIKYLGPLGNGLITKKSVSVGAVIASVPSSLCILTSRDGRCLGLSGQTDLIQNVAGDLRYPLSDSEVDSSLSWDIRLSLCLLEATAGIGLASKFWDSYTNYLTLPERATNIFCWSKKCIKGLGNMNHDIVKGALEQKSRLFNSYPELSYHENHRCTNNAAQRLYDALPDEHRASFRELLVELVPSPLEWALAMVRSRCFQVDKNWLET